MSPSNEGFQMEAHKAQEELARLGEEYCNQRKSMSEDLGNDHPDSEYAALRMTALHAEMALRRVVAAALLMRDFALACRAAAEIPEWKEKASRESDRTPESPMITSEMLETGNATSLPRIDGDRFLWYLFAAQPSSLDLLRSALDNCIPAFDRCPSVLSECAKTVCGVLHSGWWQQMDEVLVRVSEGILRKQVLSKRLIILGCVAVAPSALAVYQIIRHTMIPPINLAPLACALLIGVGLFIPVGILWSLMYGLFLRNHSREQLTCLNECRSLLTQARSCSSEGWVDEYQCYLPRK